MSVINGKSHQAIKHFRKQPAAMSVYWVYLARANLDRVAYPSLRGLERDTGWNKDTCAKARRWLVTHGALELVKNYIRPEWRNLDKDELHQRRNLDSSEYYRATGILIVDGTTYAMLYASGMDAIAEDEPETNPGVPSLRTPSASDTDGVGQNLVPLVELGTKEDSAPKKAARGTVAIPDDLRPYFEAISKITRTSLNHPGIWEYYHLFNGSVSEKRRTTDWYKYQITPGMTEDELRRFGAYRQRQHIVLNRSGECYIRKPESISNEVNLWRDKRNAQMEHAS